MDELDKLKGKLTSLFGKSQAKGAFKGKANVLGSAPAQAGVPPARQAPPARPVLKVPPPAAPAQQPVAASSSAAAAPSVPQPAKPHLQQPAAAVPPAAAALPQQHAAPAVPPHPEQVEEAPEAVSVAVGQLASEPAGAAAAEVLAKLLGNIVAAPADPKFRRVRLTNPRIQSAVVDVGGGLELLLACGFEIVFEEAAPPAGAAAAGSSGGDAGEAAAEASSEGYAVLAEGADLEPLRQALRLLAGLLPSAPAGARPAAAPPASRPVTDAPRPAQQQPAQQQQRPGRPPREWEAARERNTQASCLASWVVLPTSLERDVPDWFFQRTGLELKAAFIGLAWQSCAGVLDGVLMTRAMRERLRGGPGRAAATHATLKVRFPEGISLQGEFGAGEPVAAVFAWVADCLSDPLHTYELVLPSRQPLEAKAQSVREADLVPSVALLFRWTGQSAVEMAHVPALRPELLRAARPAAASY
ncbi:hypothetical protein CHLNCDRAFT_143046 [Chlorella variabilis]|uniref:UBX domain-containing protein n=1 Tax=Chlorella variabilis TaxID=554065 RepID=E1Z9C8_CHLVA|nr:hypothetical protein CHLNCDRAFT_143046 [Chlorella variabilis]EFN57494.1 hypothetical protein CHLNCDRAFT_143046 [Chlorella variabilis]|eukprot:XP_005849596.1 hypothetical protein CHLNCDRAFT_143046 [Chlorella variabilis]